ncbi:hypothetical protein BJ165DRAFT_1409872 [Panaeolus papilionaceus]|nr:hypothetical protein BJ165DRAFT_1409872 [Panaeolus papilionaceus]
MSSNQSRERDAAYIIARHIPVSTIQAGRFDNKSTQEEQDEFLRSILEADQEEKNEEADDMNNEELNEHISRYENQIKKRHEEGANANANTSPMQVKMKKSYYQLISQPNALSTFQQVRIAFLQDRAALHLQLCFRKNLCEDYWWQ